MKIIEGLARRTEQDIFFVSVLLQLRKEIGHERPDIRGTCRQLLVSELSFQDTRLLQKGYVVLAQFLDRSRHGQSLLVGEQDREELALFKGEMLGQLEGEQLTQGGQFLNGISCLVASEKLAKILDGA